MNNTQNIISDIQNKLIEVENYIVKNKHSTSRVAFAEMNNKISEIRGLALTLGEHYSAEQYSVNQMKLSSTTNYSEVKQKVHSFMIGSFVLNFNGMYFDKAFELYQKFLSEGRLKQQEYSKLHRAICDHPELDTASLAQILFFIKQYEYPFIEKKIIHTIAGKGVLSFPGIESLSRSEYFSLLSIAVRYQCNGICNDLMQLKQYNIFLPNDHDFRCIIRESLQARNISVFESLVKHLLNSHSEGSALSL